MQAAIEQTKPQQKSHSDSFDGDDKNATADIFLQNYMNSEQQKQPNRCQKGVKIILESIYFQVFITILALYSLFSDDIRTATTYASTDIIFDSIHIAMIGIFMIEIVFSWICYKEYRWSFYFVLDLVSSLSLLLDISMLTDDNSSGTYNVTKLATQSRASRVATKAVRIVKLVRIIRIVKLYKAASIANDLKRQQKRKQLQQLKKKSSLNQTQSQKSSKITHMEPEQQSHDKQNTAGNIFNTQNAETKTNKQKQQEIVQDDMTLQEAQKRQSKVSKVMSDLTIKKIVIVVLLLMIIVPLFDNTLYIERSQSWDYLTYSIHKLLYSPDLISTPSISQMINDMISQHQAQNYLLYFSTPFNELPRYQHDNYDLERQSDIVPSIETINVSQILSVRADLTLRSNLASNQDNQIYAVMSYRYNNTVGALFSIGNTIFVCLVLVAMLYFFTSDINRLIVNPIQMMMKQVIEMAKNPQSVTLAQIDNNKYQTAVVHNAIVKIGALLSLVFGSAGAQIIGSNIMSEGDMNPMIGGKKKCAIFGFCDIKQFTQVTELLQEDIMLFVNKIGELVHSSVYRYGGSANKNIGEAFLMIWPLHENSYKIDHKTNQITWKREKYVNVMSDFSVLSFIKAIVKINKDPDILEYKKNKKLQDGLPGYQVKMGFGLHIGWAIQGAIGSQYKIDASYLSPNVNMASRLQAATKQFGVHILISEDLYQNMTPSLKKFCRNIDRVTVKGSAKPIRLYTIDLKLENITPPMDKKIKYKNMDDMLDVQTKKQINMEYLTQQKIDAYNAQQFIKSKKQLRQVMIDAVSTQFKKRFQLGLDCYIGGRWSDAKLHFNEALKYYKNDGPTNNILNYMKKFQYMVPETWKNYRPLTEK